MDFEFWSRTATLDHSNVIFGNQNYLRCNFKYPEGHKYLLKTLNVHVNHWPLLSPDISDFEVMGPTGRWQYFLTWVAKVSKIDPALTQYDWWASNEMSFRFLDLPPELRACLQTSFRSLQLAT